MPTMERTILQTFQTKFLDIGFGQYIKHNDRKNNTVTFNNGSQLIFMAENFDSDKELNRFRGLEINGAGADELNELHQETFNKLIERAGSWIGSPGCPIKILATCNPSQGWVKEVFYKRWANGTLPANWAYVPAKITDNPYVTPEFLESLKNLPPDQYAIFVDGDWNAFAVNNPYAYCFDEKKHVADNLMYDPDLQLLISFDFNIDPITCIVAQHDEFCDPPELRIIKEFKLSNANSADLCDRIIAEYDHHNPIYKITGDGTGHNRNAISGNVNHYHIIKAALQLGGQQVKAPRKNMGPKNLRTLMNSLLQNYVVKIDSRCESLLNDMKYVEVDEWGDVRKDRSNDNRKADHLDCFAYLNEMEFKSFVKYSHSDNDREENIN